MCLCARVCMCVFEFFFNFLACTLTFRHNCNLVTYAAFYQRCSSDKDIALIPIIPVWGNWASFLQPQFVVVASIHPSEGLGKTHFYRSIRPYDYSKPSPRLDLPAGRLKGERRSVSKNTLPHPFRYLQLTPKKQSSPF